VLHTTAKIKYPGLETVSGQMEMESGLVSDAHNLLQADSTSHTRTLRHLSAEQKAAAVRRHLGGKEPKSKLAEELGRQPSLIHN